MRSRIRHRCSRPRSRLGVDPADCIYVGDDLRDVQAGRAAAMGTVVAAWGYLGLGDAIEDWGADHIIRAPARSLEAVADDLNYGFWG